MKTEHAVSALAALAQETRLGAYRVLVQAGPQGLAAGHIARRLAVPAATLSFHLKELANAGLVMWQQRGRYVIYSANYDEMNALLGFLTEHCCQGAVDDCPKVRELATTTCRPPRLRAPSRPVKVSSQRSAPRKKPSK